MNKIEIIDRLTSINVWTRGTRRAPHKPLLLLLVLARCSRGEPREISYREVDQKLGALLREFGPPSRSYHPEYPFWRLQNDGIWLVRDAGNLALRTGHSDVRKSELLRTNVKGGMTPELYDALQNDHKLLVDVAQAILDAHFPATLHDDILSAVGLDLERSTSSRAKRDPAFREKVLRAYERRCAICGFDLRLGAVDVALEAAHIMWHEAGGPDVECNGLALCTMHHKLLDRGVFTVSVERLLLVSQDVSGSQGLNEQLLRFHATPIREPQSREFMPSPKYLEWHGDQVFRKPARVT